MMYGAEDDLVDIGENDSGSVGGLLDGARPSHKGNQSIPPMDATEVVMVPCLLKM